MDQFPINNTFNVPHLLDEINWLKLFPHLGYKASIAFVKKTILGKSLTLIGCKAVLMGDIPNKRTGNLNPILPPD
jgi:hypothetical protein